MKLFSTLRILSMSGMMALTTAAWGAGGGAGGPAEEYPSASHNLIRLLILPDSVAPGASESLVHGAKYISAEAAGIMFDGLLHRGDLETAFGLYKSLDGLATSGVSDGARAKQKREIAAHIHTAVPPYLTELLSKTQVPQAMALFEVYGHCFPAEALALHDDFEVHVLESMAVMAKIHVRDAFLRLPPSQLNPIPLAEGFRGALRAAALRAVTEAGEAETARLAALLAAAPAAGGGDPTTAPAASEN
jgi:hypothetical protein